MHGILEMCYFRIFNIEYIDKAEMNSVAFFAVIIFPKASHEGRLRIWNFSRFSRVRWNLLFLIAVVFRRSKHIVRLTNLLSPFRWNSGMQIYYISWWNFFFFAKTRMHFALRAIGLTMSWFAQWQICKI